MAELCMLLHKKVRSTCLSNFQACTTFPAQQSSGFTLSIMIRYKPFVELQAHTRNERNVIYKCYLFIK